MSTVPGTGVSHTRQLHTCQLLKKIASSTRMHAYAHMHQTWITLNTWLLRQAASQMSKLNTHT